MKHKIAALFKNALRGCGVVILFLFSTISGYSQTYINEFMALNGSVVVNPYNYNYCDWIELYNSDTAQVDLGGYFLTDDLSNPSKWQIASLVIPAGGYAIIWADGSNSNGRTSFKLSGDGEAIGLYNTDTVAVDTIIFGPQNADISFGRKPDGADLWAFFEAPTPGKANLSLAFNSVIRAEEPIFSKNGGLAQPGNIVEISRPNVNGFLQYTTDGSLPDGQTPYLEGPISITIDSTTIIRARFVDTMGYMPSNTVTNSYIVLDNTTLPVISIVTDPDYLWGDTLGIYTVGTNGVYSWGITANYWREWERPISFEMYEEDGSQAVKINAGIAINGARRNMAQKSLRVFARNLYGARSIDYKIFKDKATSSFTSLVLRNGGLPDFEKTHIRDGVNHTFTTKYFDLDNQGHRPAIVLLNGEYWGIYNIREKQNEDYIASYHEIDPANLDILESNAGVVEGDAIDYNNMLAFLESSAPEDPATYDYLESKIEINEYSDYLIYQMFINNYDWPGLNIKFWRPRTYDGKWRWILFDTDAGLGLWGNSAFNMVNHVTKVDGPAWPNPPWSTNLIRKVFAIPEFRDRFLQVYAYYMNNVFTEENYFEIIDSLKSNIEMEMPRHIERWRYDTSETDGVTVGSMTAWVANINAMKDFVHNRSNNVYSHLMGYFAVQDTAWLTTHAEHGKIQIYGKDLPSGTASGKYFAKVPMTVNAVPDIGYRFSHWIGISGNIGAEVDIEIDADLDLTAVFVPSDESIVPSYIASDTTLYYNLSPYLGIADIIVDSNATLTIEPGVEIKMADTVNFIVYGQLRIDGTPELPVRIYPDTEAGVEQWGAINVINATDTTFLSNAELTGCSRGHDRVNLKAAISVYNSSVELYGMHVRDANQPFFSQFGDYISIRNCNFRSKATCDLLNIKYAQYAIVENCDFKGNDAPDTDAIDYDQINGGIIRGNKIYGFNGFNSDAIDIGEGAQNILIENNRIMNCTDKGVSVGQASSAIVRRNLIANCSLGIGVKDSLSYAFVDQNTFYNNEYAVAAFEKNAGAGGGAITVQNTIMANNTVASYFVDELSSVEITYSLSNTDVMPGTGNLLDDPGFVSPLIANFELHTFSPCIDAGDPASDLDEDNTRADMGAYFTYQPEQPGSVVINEINYHSPDTAMADDWLELYNNSTDQVDISGWLVMDANDNNRFIFPEGMILNAEEYLVLVQTETAFRQIHPDVYNFLPDLGFGLSNSGDLIRIFDGKMNVQDIVEYDDIDPWPIPPDGFGPTLELVYPDLDNALASSWKASSIDYGTPGKENTVYNFLEEFSDNSDLVLYPNPSSEYIYIKGLENETGQVVLNIYNISGVCVFSERQDNVSGSFHIDLSGISKGIYILQINTESQSFEPRRFVRL